MEDPAFITSVTWAEIGKWLHALWSFFFLTIVFGFSMLIGHAFIPSLVSTGHLPQHMLKMRRTFTAVAILALVAAMVFLSIAVARTALLENVYDRWWI